MENLYFYSGASMRGTFRNGDFLYLEKTNFSDIKVGEIVVFCHLVKGDEKKIVHRVIARKSDGSLITQGDNRIEYDFLAVSEADLIGRVTSFYRCKKRKRVFTYWNSLFLVANIRRKLLLKLFVKSTLRSLYDFIRKIGVVRYFWRPEIQKIRQIGPDGNILDKYIYNRKTVATFDHGKSTFICEKPFDLIIQTPHVGSV